MEEFEITVRSLESAKKNEADNSKRWTLTKRWTLIKKGRPSARADDALSLAAGQTVRKYSGLQGKCISTRSFLV